MYKLKWLIVCLLVSFSSFSQIDTSKPVVILSEDQAREVVKDLIKYDNLKVLYAELEQRIEILTKKEELLYARLSTKDSIISTQQNYIDVQESIINKKKPIRFNGFVGVQTFTQGIEAPMLYAQADAIIRKIVIGARYYIQPNNPSGFSFLVQYKIF